MIAYLSHLFRNPGVEFPFPTIYLSDFELVKACESGAAAIADMMKVILRLEGLKEEMHEISFGLELSHVNFIWVIRFPLGQEITPDEALSEGFLKRVGDWGKNCEKLRTTGKNIGTSNYRSQSMPRLVVEIGVGVEIMRDKNGKFDRQVIAKVIKDVVVEKMGENVRRKMRDVREKMKSRENQELGEVVVLLKQLVKENGHPST
ncbi:hypothetical protein ACH5RR_019000 [Cinchona calisaya]|uniref:Uncharacterized protein n=1 Tax=Cinchona calisaya TaxID=153742 RepID=A0ABD2ZN35_9GENT